MLTVITPEALVPQVHPIRRIKPIVDRALAQLFPIFDGMYADHGRASIPPEHLLKASLLMALYSVRSERQFCERLEYDLLFKWFLDLNITDRSFDHSMFAKNRQRLLDADVAREFLLQIVAQAREQRLLSEDHFSVDGTLLEAWASLKSFRPRDADPPSSAALGDGGGGRNREVDFRGERRRNETHRSTTDPEARLARKGKGKEARLCFGAHVLMDNREGLVVDVRLTPADGACERDAALEMLASAPGTRRITVGADRGYDTRTFVRECRNLKVTPHVAQKQRSAIDRRTTRHDGYRVSQRARKRIEEVFGWVKTVGGGRKLRYCGVARNRLWVELTIAGYNLVRLAKLTAVAA
jgi:transposase